MDRERIKWEREGNRGEVQGELGAGTRCGCGARNVMDGGGLRKEEIKKLNGLRGKGRGIEVEVEDERKKFLSYPRGVSLAERL